MRHVARTVEMRGAYRVLLRNPEGKRPFRIHKLRWEENNTMDLQEVECVGMDWIVRWVASTSIRDNEVTGFVKCRKFID